MTLHDKVLLGEAAASLAYEAGQRMLESLGSNEKPEALRAAEQDFAALLKMNLGTFPQLGQRVNLTWLSDHESA